MYQAVRYDCELSADQPSIDFSRNTLKCRIGVCDKKWSGVEPLVPWVALIFYNGVMQGGLRGNKQTHESVNHGSPCTFMLVAIRHITRRTCDDRESMGNWNLKKRGDRLATDGIDLHL